MALLPQCFAKIHNNLQMDKFQITNNTFFHKINQKQVLLLLFEADLGLNAMFN